MRLFNSFQITGAFVAWPFLIAWLDEAAFRGAPVAFWSAIVLYIVAFCCMVGCVYSTMEKSKW